LFPLIKKGGGIWPDDVLATPASRVLLPSRIKAHSLGKDEINRFLNQYNLTGTILIGKEPALAALIFA
jgi:hypothetical protein